MWTFCGMLHKYITILIVIKQPKQEMGYCVTRERYQNQMEVPHQMAVLPALPRTNSDETTGTKGIQRFKSSWDYRTDSCVDCESKKSVKRYVMVSKQKPTEDNMWSVDRETNLVNWLLTERIRLLETSIRNYIKNCATLNACCIAYLSLYVSVACDQAIVR